jgi:hypothetical protein
MKYVFEDGVMHLYTDDGEEIKYNGELRVEREYDFIPDGYGDLNLTGCIDDVYTSESEESFQILRLLKRLVNAQDQLYIARNELDEDIIDEDTQEEVNEIYKSLNFLISDILKDVKV